jgi:hypothetical protein
MKLSDLMGLKTFFLWRQKRKTERTRKRYATKIFGQKNGNFRYYKLLKPTEIYFYTASNSRAVHFRKYVDIHKEYHSVYSLVGIVTLPTPLSPASVPLPPEPWGAHSHAAEDEGLGESRFRRLEKKLSTLPTL